MRSLYSVECLALTLKEVPLVLIISCFDSVVDEVLARTDRRSPHISLIQSCSSYLNNDTLDVF